MKPTTQLGALAILAGLGLAAGGPPAFAQWGTDTEVNAAICDRDGNGYVTPDEADTCFEREYDYILGDKQAATEEDLDMWFEEHKEATGYAFTNLDADQSGDVSRDEYREWRRSSFDEQAGEAGMAADDYDTWHPGVEPGGGDSGADER